MKDQFSSNSSMTIRGYFLTTSAGATYTRPRRLGTAMREPGQPFLFTSARWIPESASLIGMTRLAVRRDVVANCLPVIFLCAVAGDLENLSSERVLWHALTEPRRSPWQRAALGDCRHACCSLYATRTGLANIRSFARRAGRPVCLA